MSLLPEAARREAFAEASRFRGDFYECLTARRDELFELVDAVLCADGAVKSAVDLTLLPEHRRGHGECRSRRYESAPHRSGRSGHKDAPLGERGVFREHHCSSAAAARPPAERAERDGHADPDPHEPLDRSQPGALPGYGRLHDRHEVRHQTESLGVTR